MHVPSFQRLRTCAAACLVLPALAVTAATPDPSDPADPSVTVPTSRYESIFQQYQPDAADPATPDTLWRSANAAVANTGQHGHLMAAPASQPEPVTSQNAGKSPSPAGDIAPTPTPAPSPPAKQAPATRAPAAPMHHQHGEGR